MRVEWSSHSCSIFKIAMMSGRHSSTIIGILLSYSRNLKIEFLLHWDNITHMDRKWICRCPFRIMLLCWNTVTRSKLGEKRFTWLTLPPHSERWKSWVWEPRRKSWCRDNGRELLTDLFFKACSDYFLREIRTSSPGRALPTIDLALSINHY